MLSRPFRSPNHTISKSALIGGGKIAKPGEISLAHFGVLFLDELPEFNKKTIEMLRGPIEDGEVSISRIAGIFKYPCNFMLIASMNPCPCGYFGSEVKECKCTERQINAYRGKISGPILDRIDIQVEVPNIKFENLENIKEEKSETIRERVDRARKIQVERYNGLNIYSNSELNPKLIDRFCKLNQEAKDILKIAFEKFKLSARAYARILKLARTIADLEGKENIETYHVLEAIQYRGLDRRC